MKQMKKIEQKVIIIQKFSMPFIFHSEKLSIFESKPQILILKNNQKIECLTHNKLISLTPIKQNAIVCKEHPFRKLKKSADKLSHFTQLQINDSNHNFSKQQRPYKKYACKPQKVGNIDSQVQSKSNPLSQNTQIPKFFANFGKQDTRIHRQTSPSQEDYIKNLEVAKLVREQKYQNQERLKYMIDENPGPGSYDVTVTKHQKSAVLYKGISQTVSSLPPKKRNSLDQFSLLIEQKIPKRQSINFIMDCNYKNQNSPSFKSRILGKSSHKKNEALLSLLFSKKISENKQNLSETTCESRMAGTTKGQIYEDEFQKNEEKSPGPSSYDPNIENNKQTKGKKLKPFLSGEAKKMSYINRELTPSPGAYLEAINKKRYVFDQNQIKRPNIFKHYDDQPQKICAFSSGVPRELHFDTQNLCRQELYYSPKNSMSDQVQIRIQKGNRSNKVQFGSSLERFLKDQVKEDDPFKYCFAKVINSHMNSSCPSLNFKEKRQIFKPIQNTVASNKYHDSTNTIYKSTEKQLFRKLIHSKYQDEVILLKQKKKSMESLLIEENRKSFDMKNPQKESSDLDPDNYKNYLFNRKMAQKKNIAFGYHKESKIDRATEPRKQLDLYYDTEPKWDIKSFNKEYGYQLEEK